MTYDRDLADRVRAALSTERGVTEKAMFGGLAFLVEGALVVAASGRGGLMVRCDPERTEELVAAAGVERMVMRGRELDGWLRVAAQVVDDDAELRHWVAVGQSATAGAGISDTRQDASRAVPDPRGGRHRGRPRLRRESEPPGVPCARS